MSPVFAVARGHTGKDTVKLYREGKGNLIIQEARPKAPLFVLKWAVHWFKLIMGHILLLFPL